MAIEGIKNDYILPPLPPVKNSHLNSEDFMRLLVVQLATQNPLEPMNDRDFFAQMAQLGTVDGINRLETSLQMSQASSLIGHIVQINPGVGTNEPIIGYVEGVEVHSGKAFVVVNGSAYSVDKIVRVTL